MSNRLIVVFAMLVAWPGVGMADDGALSINLEVSPRPLVYGRVHDAVIKVSNDSADARQVEVRALLGEVAHFVGAEGAVRFENPEQAAQERKLIWPVLDVPGQGQEEVFFQFLVTWDATGDLYLQVDALDPAGVLPTQVAHHREAPQYPAGRGGFLAEYGYILFSLVVFAAIMFSVHRAGRLMNEGNGIISSFWGPITGAGVLFVVITGSIIWSELEPSFGWKEAVCDILDVRYSVNASTSTTGTGSNQQQSTINFYAASLTLRYDGPDGSMVSSGYRKQTSIDDPSELEPYKAGMSLSCFYDPDDPAWVVVERELVLSSIVKETILVLFGLLLVWFGLKSRRGIRST